MDQAFGQNIICVLSTVLPHAHGRDGVLGRFFMLLVLGRPLFRPHRHPRSSHQA